MKIFDQIENHGFLNPATTEGPILYAAIFAVVAWLLGELLRLTVEHALARDKHEYFERMAVKFIAKLLRYCVYVFAVVAYAHLVPGLSGLGAASLTSISVLTIVIGLAAQNTLGNLVAGLSLLLYRPFKLGDRIEVLAPSGVETGIVENEAICRGWHWHSVPADNPGIERRAH
jgi:small conductance mechanosensitive channel